MIETFLNAEGQPIEGIDKIKLAFQPYLAPFINMNTQIDAKNLVQVNYNHSYYSNFFYLNIHGKFINHDTDIRDSIASAILLLIERDALKINSVLKNGGALKPYITKEFILENLTLFIHHPMELEFSFDFTRDALRIREGVRIIETWDKNSIAGHLKIPIKKREPVLIKYGNTLYSGDYRKNRKSSVRIYDRDQKLRDKNHTRREDIDGNPFKIRLEFNLDRSNDGRMSLENIGGTYDGMIRRFTPLLAIKYKKYLADCIDIQDDGLHPYFSGILENTTSAKKYLRDRGLANRQTDRYRIPRYTEVNGPSRLDNEIRKNKREMERERRMKKPRTRETDTALFTENQICLCGMAITMMKFLTIYDLRDDRNLLFETEGFTFTKDSPFWTKGGGYFTAGCSG
jgi:hypothetical protein